ncbi:hypothetical protein BCR42DRAFT_398863 [Absidia repens]|uniref:Uncharacterized protein n=1 Tax=Absidia repens TaxID=90262 RepID=A0A1X2HR46_9FUNG|nr:hypothetical protein BCR42DRAFT_398863 [Absidia repens]
MNSTYPTPSVTPANPIDSEAWSDDCRHPARHHLASKCDGNGIVINEHTVQLTKTALDKFSQAHWEKKNALEVELVPRLIELIHQIFKPRPTPEAYRELARSFIHATLNQEQQSESFRPIWREINVQDPWLKAGGPASSGLADIGVAS